MSVREKIRNRIKQLQKTAQEATKTGDQKTVLNSILRADECREILKLL